MTQPSTIERALQLARSGTCRTVEDVRRKLKAERCDAVDSHLGSGSLKRQLVEAMKMLD